MHSRLNPVAHQWRPSRRRRRGVGEWLEVVRVRPGPRDETFAAPKPVIRLPGCALAARKKSPLHFFYLQNVRFVRVLRTRDRSGRSACGQGAVRVRSEPALDPRPASVECRGSHRPATVPRDRRQQPWASGIACTYRVGRERCPAT